MPLLHIAFQDGFENDEVVVLVNGEEVYRRGDVTTRYQISFAGSFEADVAEGPVDVEVRLPERDLSLMVPLQVSTTLYLAVSLLDGIVYRVSDAPFRYA